MVRILYLFSVGLILLGFYYATLGWPAAPFGIEEDKNLGCEVIIPEGLYYDLSEEKGFSIFKNNCSGCHSISLVTDMRGPALLNLHARTSANNITTQQIFNHLRNGNQDEEEIPYFKELSLKWNGEQCGFFPKMTDEELREIFRGLGYPRDSL